MFEWFNEEGYGIIPRFCLKNFTNGLNDVDEEFLGAFDSSKQGES